ncbi:MAG TPA: TonB-dependent receptor plug domain-containing protein [Opitutaceae bacterium]|nr:TonB-dependent receptor plug domain-containing protein [Opitutaceae bacterium]
MTSCTRDTVFPLRRSCTFVLLLTASTLVAQTAPTPLPDLDSATVERYDKNANGRLDPDESAAMQADQARNASATVTATAAASGDVVQMSPFEVSGAGDKGYYASNTLSGTRLNTKLEDVGASITVVTKQQMEDFALVDVNDIFMYEANTEGTATYTDFTVDRNGNVIDNVAGNPNNANRVRGIAAANQSRGNYWVSGRVPLDSFFVDSIEISRGPNSSIFGLGNASGTVNAIPVTANLQRERSRVELRTDQVGSFRSGIDLNRPLIKDKLAVRGVGVFQEDQYKLKPSISRTKHVAGLVTYRPFKNTTIRAGVDYYENYARRPNTVLPRDAITYWEQQGKPTWDPTTWTVTRNGVNTVVPYVSNQGTETTNLGAGLESGGTGLYARPSLFINPDGSIPIYMVGRQSGLDTTGLATPNAQAGNVRLVESAPAPKPGPLAASYLSLTNKAYYDWQRINMAAPNWSQVRDRTYTIELDQFLLQTPRHLVAAQLGWFREEALTYSRTFIGQGSDSPMITYIDVNTKLTDGRVNPFFGRPYINALEPTATRTPFFRDQFRAQLAYKLTLSRETNWLRWLGDHQFSGYGEYKNTITQTLRFRDAVIDNHAWLLAGANRANGAAAARGYYRYYLGDTTGDNIDSAPPAWRDANHTYPLRWYNASTQQWVDEPVTFGEAFYTGGSSAQTRNIIKTIGGAMQNHFIEDRIVTTFGIRQDINLNRDSANAGLAPDGIHLDVGPDRTWPKNWLERIGHTTTSGVVVKPLRHIKLLDQAAERGGVVGFLADFARSIDFYYNKSDSFLPQTIAQNLVGEMLPDSQGKGKDYGISFNVLGDNRLVVRINQYEATQKASRQGDSGTIATRAARLDYSNMTGGTDPFNLVRNATEWVTALNPTWSTDQINTEVAKEMGMPLETLTRMNSYPISDTSDVTSKGKEIEVNYNPSNLWTMRMTIGEMKTIDNNLSPAIGEYIAQRWSIWQTIVDPRTNTLWWTTKYRSTSPQDFYVGSVLAPYKLATANEGKPKSQIREWKVNLYSTLQLAAISDNPIVKRFAVSGAIRWEDKGSIGFYGDPNDVNAYDPNRPIFDKAHTYIDAGVSYTQKIYSNKIRMRLQLNARNLMEGGRLQPIGSLPDGRIYNYRIVDPRQFLFSASFDL